MLPSRSGSFRLFRLAGITVFLHWSWFLVAVLQIGFRPHAYSWAAWNVLEYLSLFGIVLLHEFGHALACRSVGGTARQIVLWPLGGIAYVNPPPRPGAVLWSIVAGPLVNVVLLGVSVALIFGLGLPLQLQNVPDWQQFILALSFINAALLFVNLLPFYPLDGGQILWSLLWFVVGRWTALQWVSVLGVAAGCLVGGVALWGIAEGYLGLAWLGLIALFVVLRSTAGFFQARQVLHIQSLPRHPDLVCPSCGTHPPAGPFWVCDDCQERFDLFATRGSCPACGAWYLDTACPDCGKSSRINRWFAEEPDSLVASAPLHSLKGRDAPEAEGAPRE